MPLTRPHRSAGRLLAALLVTACASSANLPAPCATDAECPSGEVCFDDGACGDPGTDLVVEIRGSAALGQYARDVPIVDKLESVRDFDLSRPLSVRCELTRGSALPPSTEEHFVSAFRLVAVGQSALIPGLGRTYEQSVSGTSEGLYEMPLGAGRFTLTAIPADSSIPPAVVDSVTVGPELPPPDAHFGFPSFASAITLVGKLIASVDTSAVLPRELPITLGAMDLQAFDPDTNAPLSQRFPVSSGQSGSTGHFAMTLSPRANGLRAFALRASPRSSADELPTKTFIIDAPVTGLLTLELGAFSQLVEVSGRALADDGSPLSGARVVIGGTVVGGGRYVSPVATTDERGAFSLRTPPAVEPLSLTVVPETGTLSAVSTLAVRVSTTGLSGLEVRSGPRVKLVGSVLRPDGLSAAGTVVRASEQSKSSYDERVLPLDDVQAYVDQDGRYELFLDRATWRLTFSTPGLPLASRLVTVDASSGVLHSLSVQETQPVRLSAGRVVSGQVLNVDRPVPFATLRFFRVAPVQGMLTSSLLGAAVADANGTYSVVLPTH